jgi:hypothetical protein
VRSTYPSDIASTVVLLHDADVSFFRNADEAARFLEPLDVGDKSLMVFDADGRRLHMDVERKPGVGLLPGNVDHVTLTPGAKLWSNHQTVRSLLVDRLLR